MPRVSAFYGVVIAMYFSDHPPPHFHVRYAEYGGRVEIATGELLDGTLPPRALKMVKRWTGLHRAELAENWRRAMVEHPLSIIDPLP